MKCPKCQAENTSDSQFCKKCTTPLPSPEDIPVSHTKTLETPVEELSRGTTFAGRYEIIEELCRDGMGKVYKAEGTKIKQEVELKLIKPEIASDKIGIGKLKEEKISEAKWKNSIVVLPFADLSPQKDQEYFCDGIAEELINTLTKVEDLRIVARTSAFSFKGEKLDACEIGKKLNVETVLEGSVRKAGSRVRITATLINVADGYHLWSEKYDRDMEDIFVIQDEIFLAIVGKLKVKLLEGEEAKLVKRHTDDLEAYNLYLRGRYFFNMRFNPQKALMCFQQALEKDPQYALAYVGISGCYSQLGFFGFRPQKEAYPKAKAAIEKALEINDKIGEAHAFMASIKIHFNKDWEDAEIEFKRAIKLNPGYAAARRYYASYLLVIGRFDEALVEWKKAQELDPLSFYIKMLGEVIFYFARQCDESIE